MLGFIAIQPLFYVVGPEVAVEVCLEGLQFGGLQDALERFKFQFESR